MAEQLDPAVEQQLADLSDDDWRSLSARVRPPTSSEQLKTVASQMLSESQLQSFMAIADPRKFAGANGDVDEGKVKSYLDAFFGAGQPPNGQAPDYGQGSALGGPVSLPGNEARAALKKRHGVGAEGPHNPGRHSPVDFGAGGHAALHKRHGVNRIQQ
ncbi:hypothetical protein [Mycobacterium sp. E3251]|uniref:hypothetical protein n=1 Tax=Mycobacterium sp. E3251 TaxID=1834144 RepID=UPI0012E92AB1|nr:hypothetical protein [Mycobacterium sp. E3251]